MRLDKSTEEVFVGMCACVCCGDGWSEEGGFSDNKEQENLRVEGKKEDLIPIISFGLCL